ncbi:hypothetical protein LBMAG10_09900 [Actinomycetes bacterium]|nr:hypothetical protein LBMAG10_09900 [Actinomycetes bacterium]
MHIVEIVNLIAAIGEKPLVRLGSTVPANSVEVWVKYVSNNSTGSYKDGMAIGMIKERYSCVF